MSNHQSLIEETFESGNVDSPEVQKAIVQTIEQIDRGELRICSPKGNHEWEVHQWLKKAVLLYFKITKNEVIESGAFRFVDKIPLKKWTGKEGVRVVPQALARFGSFVAPGAVMMPSYVNIGAYVDEGTMVDTWATVGSCAQIGKNVHLSGGVGIGGVLEPLQAAPVIIEDDVFVGSRCIVVEGVQVQSGAVLGAGVTITASTRIVDVTGPEEKVFKGVVPENSVVIPGVSQKKFAAGTYGIPCAMIIGKRTETTDKKTSLNNVLRDFEIAV